MSDATAGLTQHPRGPRQLELTRLRLVVAAGSRAGREHVLGQGLCRVGKSDDNELQLPDDTVSRHHCEIAHDERGYLVRDLGSTNGTYLDGAEIKEAYLRPGATLTVGKVELRVRPLASPIELSASSAERFGEVVGRSTKMRELFSLCERLAPTDAGILLGGETGTGKDVLARALHGHSRRRDKPLVVVDCGAVVGNLIESELFGHEKGAFTGATGQRAGAFELAHGGTIFLDEVGELPLELQPKLLRVLEARRFRRVGGNRELSVDVRVIAASKRNLELEVERGKFREDLYFRLAVVTLELPPLRERRDDIPMLAEGLLEKLAERESPPGPPLRASPAVLQTLRAHDWPGNVRELRNVLERAAYLSRAEGSAELMLSQLPFAARPAQSSGVLAPGEEFDPTLSYRETRARFEDSFERAYVSWLIERHEGNISAAARAAEMDRKYLHRLAVKHGLKE